MMSRMVFKILVFTSSKNEIIFDALGDLLADALRFSKSASNFISFGIIS